MQTSIKGTHNVSAEWLQARKEHQILTASEIRKLIPAGKKVLGFTYRKKEITIDDIKQAEPLSFEEKPEAYEQFVKAGADKVAEVPVDTTSYDAAARGHYFEPYAIKQFNKDYNQKFHHGDDTLIRNLDKGIGYSPDALSLKQPKDCPVTIETGQESDNKYDLLEIKCYDAGNHYMHSITKPETGDERWQIATAMVTDPNIETGTLYLWNPSVELYGLGNIYTREDLSLEMAIVESILDVYNGIKKTLSKNKDKKKPMFTISEITTDYLQEKGDPEKAIQGMVV